MLIQAVYEGYVQLNTAKLQKAADDKYGGNISELMVKDYGMYPDEDQLTKKIDKGQIFIRQVDMRGGKKKRVNRFLQDFEAVLKPNVMSKFAPDGADGYVYDNPKGGGSLGEVTEPKDSPAAVTAGSLTSASSRKSVQAVSTSSTSTSVASSNAPTPAPASPTTTITTTPTPTVTASPNASAGKVTSNVRDLQFGSGEVVIKAVPVGESPTEIIYELSFGRNTTSYIHDKKKGLEDKKVVEGIKVFLRTNPQTLFEPFTSNIYKVFKFGSNEFVMGTASGEIFSRDGGIAITLTDCSVDRSAEGSIYTLGKKQLTSVRSLDYYLEGIIDSLVSKKYPGIEDGYTFEIAGDSVYATLTGVSNDGKMSFEISPAYMPSFTIRIDSGKSGKELKEEVFDAVTQNLDKIISDFVKDWKVSGQSIIPNCPKFIGDIESRADMSLLKKNGSLIYNVSVAMTNGSTGISFNVSVGRQSKSVISTLQKAIISEITAAFGKAVAVIGKRTYDRILQTSSGKTSEESIIADNLMRRMDKLLDIDADFDLEVTFSRVSAHSKGLVSVSISILYDKSEVDDKGVKELTKALEKVLLSMSVKGAIKEGIRGGKKGYTGQILCAITDSTLNNFVKEFKMDESGFYVADTSIVNE